jgi:hypothetical protein
MKNCLQQLIWIFIPEMPTREEKENSSIAFKRSEPR